MNKPTESGEHLPQQQQAIRSRCACPTDSFLEFKNEVVEQSIPDRFEQQAARHPDRIAVKTKEQAVTYNTLNQAANRLARVILARSNSNEEPVALLLETGVSMIGAILAVLKAGQTYVTLDPGFPCSRLAYMLEDSGADLIVTNHQNLALADKLARNTCKLINVDQLPADVCAENLALRISPDAAAYIIYTSGSTGQPKGIVHSHRSVLHGIMNYTNAFRICPDDRLTLLHSCSFSSAMVDIFCALLNGAAVYPWDVKREGLADLARWLSQEAITIYSWIPTPFRHFVETLTGHDRFPRLRLLILASEPVLKKDVELYKKHFSSNCILVNRLGTTETYNFRLFFIDRETRLSGSTVPAGYAVPGKQVLLLDDAGEEVGPNRIGEIAVKSRYLALGYWRRPELTRAVFLPDPAGGSERIYLTGDLGLLRPDGCLEYLGRKDFQVKVSGHRIEVAEIEMALHALKEIKDVAVFATQDNANNKRLVAYVVPATELAPTITQLREAVFKTLPDYMIPSAFVMLDELPLTPTGKVDRRALPNPAPNRPDLKEPFVFPQNMQERQLRDIWEQVLGVQPIGVKDNFFELGGHSLSAMRMLAQLEQVTGTKLSLTTLFQAPTIKELAKILRHNEASPSWSSLVAIRSGNFKPPFFCIPGNLGNVFTDLGDLARHLGPDQPFYGLQDGIQNPAQIEALALHYLDEIRRVQSEPPYLLGGVCSGGMVAFEMAQQLQRQGQAVALLALIEPVPPLGPGLRSYMDFVALIGRRFARRFSYHSSNFLQLTPAEQKTYARLKTKLMANSWALRRYTPKPYPGPIHLFLASESLKAGQNPQLNWQKWAIGGMEVYEISGSHNTITGDNETKIEEADMQVLAGQLKVCIDKALADDHNC